MDTGASAAAMAPEAVQVVLLSVYNQVLTWGTSSSWGPKSASTETMCEGGIAAHDSAPAVAASAKVASCEQAYPIGWNHRQERVAHHGPCLADHGRSLGSGVPRD